MKATDIEWNIDLDEAYGRLDEMTCEEASKALGIPVKHYANMTTEERHDFAYSQWHHCRATLEKFMGLPNEVDIPDSFSKQDDEDGLIADWISDEYGFCISGYTLVA